MGNTWKYFSVKMSQMLMYICFSMSHDKKRLRLDETAKFKKHYFVSYDPKRATKQDKKERLENVLMVRRNTMMSLL